MVNNHIKAVTAQNAGVSAQKDEVTAQTAGVTAQNAAYPHKRDDNRTNRSPIRTKQNAKMLLQHLGVFSILEMIIVFCNNNTLWIVRLDMDEGDCMGVNVLHILFDCFSNIVRTTDI